MLVYCRIFKYISANITNSTNVVSQKKNRVNKLEHLEQQKNQYKYYIVTFLLVGCYAKASMYNNKSAVAASLNGVSWKKN